jgi:DNA repair protein RadC
MKFRDVDDPRRHSLWLTPSRLAELNDFALLSANLRCANRETVARALLARFRGLAGVFGADEFALRGVEGMGRDDIVDLMIVQEAAVRIARGDIARRSVVSSWTALLAYVRVAMANEPREQFRVVFLDKKNAIILDEVMNQGTVDHAPVYPREIMRRALEVDASALILVHNHPSGDPTPSAADVDMTRQVIDAGRVLRITVHDHLVVGCEGVASFKALGLMYAAQRSQTEAASAVRYTAIGRSALSRRGYPRDPAHEPKALPLASSNLKRLRKEARWLYRPTLRPLAPRPILAPRIAGHIPTTRRSNT